MTADDEQPLPRAVIVARALALEVALGAFGGALGVLLLGPVFLRAPELSIARRAIAGLALWCALLAIVVRVARAGRKRVRPALTVIALAFPALWFAAPVALATFFAAPATGSATDPFRAWATALEVFGETFTSRTLPFSLVLGAAVPFVVVGVCAASRPRTPLLALALLGAAAGYLGLVMTLVLIRRAGLWVVVDCARQAFLCGIPCAVTAMSLAPRLPRAVDLAAEIEDADRRAWRRLALSIVAVLALIGAGALGHVRHVLDALARTQGWGGDYGHAFGRGVWLDALDDRREAVRFTAMKALAALGADGSRATPRLLRLAANDASATTRWYAIDTISAVCVDGIRYEATLPTMIELTLRDPDATVRMHALQHLAALADPAAPQAFFKALADGSSPASVRKAALFALQHWWNIHPRDDRWPSPQALADALIRAHADPTFMDPDLAPGELYSVCGGLEFDFVEHLVRALSDADPHVRRLAARTFRGPLRYTIWRLTLEQRRLIDETP